MLENVSNSTQCGNACRYRNAFVIPVLLTMDTVHPIHFVPLDCVEFDPYSSHRKCCAPIQTHFYLEYLCTRDWHECMGVDEHLAVWRTLIQRTHNIFNWQIRTNELASILMNRYSGRLDAIKLKAYPSGGSSSSIWGSCVSTTTALCKNTTI